MNPDLKAEAIATFTSLLDEARAAGDPEPTAMTVATVGADGRISARVVLLKEVDERGFVFYTNTLSRKGRALAVEPQAALLFHWKTLRDQVQVRIEGSVAPVTVQEADAYFASRPRESQLGAWASLQSEPLAERAVFEARYAQFEQQFADGPVPRPPHWSGYRVAPETFEFWYGVPFRLHERRVYRLQEGIWSTGLLYP
ncbi:MAG: pyridoxamine 5'-phosphate oxidase [Lysobacteraceae bacterium]